MMTCAPQPSQARVSSDYFLLREKFGSDLSDSELHEITYSLTSYCNLLVEIWHELGEPNFHDNFRIPMILMIKNERGGIPPALLT